MIARGERFRVVAAGSELRPADDHHLDPVPPPGSDPLTARPIYLETAELS